MIRARQPQCAIALHTAPAGQDILQGIVEGVSHMQLTGNVRRGHHNGVGGFVFINDSVKIIAALPKGIGAILYLTGVIGFRQFFCHS